MFNENKFKRNKALKLLTKDLKIVQKVTTI